MSKFLSKKRRVKSLDGFKVPKGYSRDKSFNPNSTYDDETRILIVGTYTPFLGRKAGYFYCSEKNKLFSIIDCCLKPIDGLSLVDAKNDLLKNPMCKAKICKIKEILRKRKIAFLDVIEEAISPDNDPSDDAILKYVLDNESFKEIKFNKNLHIIANSKNALEALKLIDKDINAFLIPQSVRGRGNPFRTQKALIAEWKAHLLYYTIYKDLVKI